MSKIARDNPDDYNGLSARDEPAAMQEQAVKLGLDKLPSTEASGGLPMFSFGSIFGKVVHYSYDEVWALRIPDLLPEPEDVHRAIYVLRGLIQPDVIDLLEQLTLRGFTIEYPQTNKPVWRKP